MGIKIKVDKFEFSVKFECSRCHCMRPAVEYVGRAGKVMKTCQRCRNQKLKQ